MDAAAYYIIDNMGPGMIIPADGGEDEPAASDPSGI